MRLITIIDTDVKDSIRDIAISLGFSEDRYGTCKLSLGEKMFRFKFDNTSFTFDGKYKGYSGLGWSTLASGNFEDIMVIDGNIIIGGITVLSRDKLKKTFVRH